MTSPTIAAISTPVGSGGIGIIKMSGENARSIAGAIFRRSRNDSASALPETNELKSHRLYHGHIVNPDTGTVLDEVLLSYMASPRSYTREDVVEINTHSGTVVLSAILDLLIQKGATLAEPGEFTKRAFLSGRIDLTQAESVIDVINARTDKALQIAGEQLNGVLGDSVRPVRDVLLGIVAEMEAGIDFPDDMEDSDPSEGLQEMIKCDVISPLDALIENHQKGQIFREGVRMAVVGQPNVGKSSLVNRMIERDRIIVTAIPGTTRDLIDETLDIKGIPITITDTAGLHRSNDPVETIGIQKTRDYVQSSDLVLFMVDVSQPINTEDRDIYDLVENKNTIFVINKSDLVEDGFKYQIPNGWNFPSVMISALYDRGISVLKDLIAGSLINEGAIGNGNGVVPNLRHRRCLETALLASQAALYGIKEDRPDDIIVMDLKEAVNALDDILGHSTSERVIDEIFSRFCIGK